MRSLVSRCLLCVLAVASGAIALASTPAAAVTQVPGPAAHAGPSARGASCTAVRQRLASYAQRGVRSVSCESFRRITRPGPAPKPAARPGARTGAQAATLCGAGSFLIRSENCLTGTLTLRVIDTTTGEVIGTATFEVEQLIELNWLSTDFQETDFMTMTSTNDIPAATVDLTAVCSAPCAQDRSSAFGGPQTLSLGQTAEGSLDYTDVPAPGPDTMTLQYEGLAEVPGLLPPPVPASWSASSPVRCDDRIPGLPPGCVFPGVIPTLDLPIASYGAAAVGIQFAQVNLPDHWGTPGHPLYILRAAAQAERNRRRICPAYQRARFRLFPGDSCYEFPFAATYESGPMLTPPINWRSCVDIWPSNATGAWVTTPLRNYTGTQRCVRSHVPLAENTAVGLAYEFFGLENRLLDLGTLATADPFYIDVT